MKIITKIRNFLIQSGDTANAEFGRMSKYCRPLAMLLNVVGCVLAGAAIFVSVVLFVPVFFCAVICPLLAAKMVREKINGR